MFSPLEQFSIYPLGFISNLSFYVIMNSIIILALIGITILNYQYRPINTVSFILETILDSIASTHKIYNYNKWIVCLVITLLILSFNIFSNLAYSYTITSHISITIYLSITVLIMSIIELIRSNGIQFFCIFIPNGTPLWLVPLLVLIETISYLARGLSLGLRLSANLLAGHSLMIILSLFIIHFNPILIILSLFLITILYIMELLISILQTYVLLILMVSYITFPLK